MEVENSAKDLPDPTGEESEQLSALHANIREKGQNAYYYAHSVKIDGPAWDGKEEPRLLQANTPKERPPHFYEKFEMYSWADSTKYVKVYLDFECADQIDSSNISLESGKKLLKFTVKMSDTKSVQLYIDDLNNEIESVTYKSKPDKFILSLKKVNEAAWYKLRSK